MIYEFFTSRNSLANVSTFVGQAGRLFYDGTTGVLKISDGHTPGGANVQLPVATSTLLGGIKAGAGANVSVDGTLTIDTAGLPLSFGDFSANVNNLSTVNPNEDLNLLTNGTGAINLVGNLHVHTTAQGPDYPTPILMANNDGNVTVNGKLIINGQSYFFGNETNFGNIVINGITTFNGATIRNGSTVSNGNVTWNGNTTTNGSAVNNGATVFNGNVTITGVTVNNGLSEFNGDLTIAGNARLVGNTNITGNTLVTGLTTVTGNTIVTGYTTVTGNTLVTGNTVVVGTATLTGNSYITGNTFVIGTTTVIGNTFVTGQVTTITGNTYLQGNSFVTGAISITGNSVQTGLSTYIVSSINATQGAVEITGDVSGLYQTPVNQGVMLQVTGQYNLPGRLYNDGQNNYPVYVGRRYNGNVTAPSQVLNNQDVVRFGGTAYTSGGWFGNGIARIGIVANEDQTLTNQGSRIELWVTPNGNSSSNIANVVILTSSLMTVKANVAVTGNIQGNLVGNVTGTATQANVATNLAAASSILAGSMSIDPPTTGKNASVIGTFTLTGLTTSHKVVIMPQAALPDNYNIAGAWASSANTLSINFQTYAGAVDAPAVTVAYFAWI